MKKSRFLTLIAVITLVCGCRNSIREIGCDTQRNIVNEERGSMEPVWTDKEYEPASLQEIPMSEMVTTGTLENGLTYYICNSGAWIKGGRATFMLVQNTGSLVETENELGMAHFVEHMVFTKSKHFGNDQKVAYLNSIGLRFGDEINATTNFDYTEYHINSIDINAGKSVMDTCMMILRDYADGCLFDKDMVERERGIISEEYRLRKETLSKTVAGITEGTRYANRLPIGTIESIKSMTRDAMEKFYKKWYQPQNQAVIVAGDVNVGEIEELIKKNFSTMERGTTTIPQYKYEQKRHKEPRIDIQKMKGAEKAEIILTFSTANDTLTDKRNSIAWYFDKECRQDINRFIVNRLRKRSKESMLFELSTSPFELLIKDDDFLVLHLTAYPEYWQEAVKSVVEELECIKKYGWTKKEAGRNDNSNGNNLSLKDGIDFSQKPWELEIGLDVFKMQNHFVFGTYIEDTHTTTRLIDYLARKTAERRLSYMKHIVRDDNMTISLLMPDAENVKLPSKDNVMAVYKDAVNTNREETKYKYAENPNYVKIAHEMELDVTPGTIVSEKSLDLDGCVEMMLSNGVRVVVCHSKQYDIDSRVNFVRQVPVNSKDSSTKTKVSHFPNVLKDLFADFYDMRYTIDTLNEEYRSISSSLDVDDLLKVAHYRLTNTEIDPEKLENYKKRLIADIKAEKLEMGMLRASDNEEKDKRIAQVESMTVENMEKLRKEYTSNFNGSTFIIGSGITAKDLRPYIEKYLGSLPSGEAPAKITMASDIEHKDEDHIYEYKTEVPTADIEMRYVCEQNIETSQEGLIMTDAFRTILKRVLEEKIRFSSGNIYSFNTGWIFPEPPMGKMYVYVKTTCDPDSAENLTNKMNELVEGMAYKDLITQQMVDDYKNAYTMLKQYNRVRECDYCIFLTDRYRNGMDFNIFYKDYDVDDIEIEKLRAYIKNILENGYKWRGILKGVKGE